MKRKLFIGSSNEGYSIAKKLQEGIHSELGEWIECNVWKDGKIFAFNNGTLDSLMRASRRYDYGILVATKDDIVESRDSTSFAPRDNVILEIGMFLGSLGLTRAFLLIDKGSKLPSDYNGVTVPRFESNVEGSLDIAIEEIKQALKSSQNTFNLRPVPSAALALGYFENLLQKLAIARLEQGSDYNMKVLVPKNIANINVTTMLYKKKNPSQEVEIIPGKRRPSVYRLDGADESYWDIPTTLQTLNKLMDLFMPNVELGSSPEKQDWIQSELRNFKGALEMMILDCDACNGNITVEFLD